MSLTVYVQLKIITSRKGVPNFHHQRGTFPAVQCHSCSRPLFPLDCAQKTCTAAQAARAAQITLFALPSGMRAAGWIFPYQYVIAHLVQETCNVAGEPCSE